MANFSIELHKLVESGFNIFDFEYDFYDKTKKEKFHELFIDRFYNYELCCETPVRWRRYLKVKMLTVFPKYNAILKATQIEYSILDNYGLVETQNRTVVNNTQGNDVISNHTSFENSATDIGSKSNNLDSTTVHDETGKTIRKETQADDSKTIIDNENTLDATKVHSTTPKGLLSLDTIKENVFASDAERNDNKELEKGSTIVDADRENNIDEDIVRHVSDVVNADNMEGSRLDSDSNGSTSNNGSVLKSETGTQTEIYTLKREGNIGVDADADMIQKHLRLQNKFMTVYEDFFEECHDLFYQLWN